MSRFRILPALLLLLAAAAEAGTRTEGAPAPRRADARRLMAIATSALNEVARAKIPGSAPALETMRHSVAAAGTAMAARSPELFPALSAGSRALAELRLVAGRAGIGEPAATALRNLTDTWTLLRGTYGLEGLRHRRGGALTEPEKQRLAAMQRAQARLAQELRPLAGQAARAGDHASAAGLGSLADRADGIAAAAPSLDVFLLATVLGDEMQGEWAAGSRLATAEIRAARRQLDPVVESLSADAGAGFVFAIDLETEQSWSFLSEETDLPESLAAAIPAPPEAAPSRPDDAGRAEAAAAPAEEEAYAYEGEDWDGGGYEAALAAEAEEAELAAAEEAALAEAAEASTEPVGAGAEAEVSAEDLAAAAEAFAAEEGAGLASAAPDKVSGADLGGCAAGDAGCGVPAPPDEP